jgi:phage-related protein
MSIQSDYAGLVVGKPFDMLEIDTSPVGGGVYRCYSGFSTYSNANGVLDFLNVLWTPVPFLLEDLEWDGTGKVVEPTITVGDYDNILLQQAFLHDDLVGISVRVLQTTEEHLEDESYIDFGRWYVDQTQYNGRTFKCILSIPYIQRNRKIPSWVMMPDSFPALSTATGMVGG